MKAVINWGFAQNGADMKPMLVSDDLNLPLFLLIIMDIPLCTMTDLLSEK
jgi:hypothetical protein